MKEDRLTEPQKLAKTLIDGDLSIYDLPSIALNLLKKQKKRILSSFCVPILSYPHTRVQ